MIEEIKAALENEKTAIINSVETEKAALDTKTDSLLFDAINKAVYELQAFLTDLQSQQATLNAKLNPPVVETPVSEPEVAVGESQNQDQHAWLG